MSLDVDGMVGAVRDVQARFQASSEPGLAEALRPALQAAYFLLDGHGPNFVEYLSAFTDTELPSLGAFSSRDAFEAWWKTSPERPNRGVLFIAGVRYCLGYSRETGTPLLLRLPAPEELRRPAMGENQERLWLALTRAEEALQSSPEVWKGFQAAVLALHFVVEVGGAREFAHFLAHLEEPLPVLCVFETRDEADFWLMQHPRPPHGAWVRVGDEALTVGYQRERNQRVLVRFPENE